MRAVALCLLGIILACQAQAGAWPREKGEGFLSFSTESDAQGDDIFTALYVEYGITQTLTAGVDLGFSDDALYKAVAFGRLPLNQPGASWKITAEMGVGLAEEDAVLRPGLLLGRSLALGDRSGWLSLESLAYIAAEDPQEINISTDVTLGVNVTDKTKMLLQLQNGNDPMNPDYLNFAPSVVIEKKPGLHLELGMKAGLKESGDYALKLGLWRTF